VSWVGCQQLDGAKKEEMQPEEKINIKVTNWSRITITLPATFAFKLMRLIKESGISRSEFCRNAFITGVLHYSKQLGLDIYEERE
jgi:hypothetical protein